ncbi:hypothetical protein N5T80_09260 [Aliarcobacter cryaerophilus]|uniref:hypothetical protein n=1 Tax=Aliarcobacter cryaerophilus TaxID=28198 RepID=UPI0021B6035B|nr:hypothetical protein [Aliarcobacter cryaerophilus]MCT7546503.1 hypothetical protein [Aliarcobacter cryaerophilus]
MNNKIFNLYNMNVIYMVFSILIVLSLYTLGNFGFFNIFNIKYEITILLVISLFITSFLILIIDRKVHVVSLFLFYLFLSSLFLDQFNVSYTIKLLLACFVINSLFFVKMKYIDNIIKSTIVISGVFSLVGIGLFIFYFSNEGLLIGLERVFRSYDRFVDLSNIPFHQKFGFVIEKAETNFLGLEYIRSRSYSSEPSATLPLFFMVGILALFYNGFIKYLGVIILFFSIILIYSGSSILSIIISILFILGSYFIRSSVQTKSILILFSILSTLLLLAFIDISLFQNITPASKITSLPSRLLPVQESIPSLILNPFWNTENFDNSFISLFIVFSGVVPLIGISFMSYFFYKFFIVAIELYENNKIFIALLCGLLIQILLFSSGGMTTLPGIVILVLTYRLLENKVINNKG